MNRTGGYWKVAKNDNQVFRTEMKSWYSANVSSKNAKGCSSNGWLVKHTVQFALDRGVGTVDKNWITWTNMQGTVRHHKPGSTERHRSWLKLDFEVRSCSEAPLLKTWMQDLILINISTGSTELSFALHKFFRKWGFSLRSDIRCTCRYLQVKASNSNYSTIHKTGR